MQGRRHDQKAVETLEELFERTKVDPQTGCRIWQRSLRHGYGQTYFRGRVQLTHRVAYILTHGSIPKGLFVCHECDTPACCEPTHLTAGTQKYNLGGMKNRGRFPYYGENHWFRRDPSKVLRGESNGHSKLKESDVHLIRLFWKWGLSQHCIADLVGVHVMTINSIIHRRNWKHVY